MGIALLMTDRRTGEERRFDMAQPLLRIGKVAGNDLVLDRPGMSRHHCELRVQSGQLYVVDLQSRNGTFVNGHKIDRPTVLAPGVQLQLGDFVIQLDPAASRAPQVKAPRPKEMTAPTPTTAPRRGGLGEERQVTPVELKREIHASLIDKMDLKHKDLSNSTHEELRQRTTEVCTQIVQDLRSRLPAWLTPAALVKEIVDEAVALGCLEDLLADESVDEIMVCNWDRIYIEQKGRIVLTNKQFTDNAQVVAVMRRILAPIGRRIDETTPMADGRLLDGSRVHAIIPPLALSGPTLTIRKFSKTPFQIDDLIRFGSLTREMGAFLELAVKNRANIVISGGTGSGKTTLLNVTSNYIPEGERIVTVEDSAELQLQQPHVVRLESRPPNLEGKNAITIRDLVRNCLRMRPDRIVVGECRGAEALDMLQAMNTGHDGSLTTLHANTPRDAISRLETLVLMAGMDLPSHAIREQIASAVDFIVQASRLSDGSRKVTHIAAVTGMEQSVITLQMIYEFRQKGYDRDGYVVGRHHATGEIPEFVQEMRKRGLEVDLSLFRDREEAAREPDASVPRAG